MWAVRRREACRPGPILLRFASVVGPGLQASRLRTAHIEEYVYQDHLSNATKRGYHRRPGDAGVGRKGGAF